MKKQSLIALFVCAGLLLGGCASNISPNSYSSEEIGVAAKVTPAVVVSIRQVKIDNKSGVGGATGVAAGAVAGSAIGGGSRSNALGAIGGAIVGGLAGEAIDKKLHHQTGYEYILRLTKNHRVISVVQPKDLKLNVGQHVLVIHGDRLRIIPDTKK